jgi:hypothetical protein
MKMAIHQWLQKEKLPLNVDLVENLQQKKQLLEEGPLQKEKQLLEEKQRQKKQLLEEGPLQKEKQLLEEKQQKDDDKNVKKLTIFIT